LELAAGKETNPRVKQFAQRMVDDHEKANHTLQSIAQKSNNSLPYKINTEDSKSRSDPAKRPFHRAYLTAQAVEHQKTAQLLAWEIGQGEDAVVCVCKAHHAWKSLGSNLRKKQYDELVRQVLPPERVKLWDTCERDSWRPHRAYAADWKLAEAALKSELMN
jgi:hypothetical protein